MTSGFIPGNLLVSESFYTSDPGIVAGQAQLPPGCSTGCVTATANGSYPQVFNNDVADASFGVTSRIFLSEMAPAPACRPPARRCRARRSATTRRTCRRRGCRATCVDGTQWKLADTLRAGLNLGQPYTVRGYPTGDNAVTGLPWAPATDGLRNITGWVNRDGTATIWAVTSTVSGSGDQGADPNKLVQITDPLAAAAPAAGESFRAVRAARFAEVLHGVSLTPAR